MTVKELKQKLAEMPDEAVIYLYKYDEDGEASCYPDYVLLSHDRSVVAIGYEIDNE